MAGLRFHRKDPTSPNPRPRRREPRPGWRGMHPFNRFVLLFGYASLAYLLVRGILYLLVLLNGGA